MTDHLQTPERQVDHAAIWAVLVSECGKRDDRLDRVEFETHFPECREFRFMGALGFGGKVWWNNGRLYVTCYPENRTPERERMITAANKRLAELVHRWKFDGDDPYLICDCGERRDSGTGRVITKGTGHAI